MVASKNKSLWYLCAFFLSLALFMVTVTVASAQVADETLEREAQAIDRMLMCPVCPAETIDQAQVEISFQMRAVVRELLAEGRTRDEILDYFVDRYGPDILAAPPKSGSNLVAWILPIVGVAAGLVGVFLVIRSMTGSQRRMPTPAGATPTRKQQAARSTDDPDLAPYLEIADRILASRRAASKRAASNRTVAPLAATDGFASPETRDMQDHTPQQSDETHG